MIWLVAALASSQAPACEALIIATNSSPLVLGAARVPNRMPEAIEWERAGRALGRMVRSSSPNVDNVVQAMRAEQKARQEYLGALDKLQTECAIAQIQSAKEADLPRLLPNLAPFPPDGWKPPLPTAPPATPK